MNASPDIASAPVMDRRASGVRHKRLATVLLVCAILLYSVALSVLSIAQFRSFSSVNTVDASIWTHAFYHTSRGNFLSGTIADEKLGSIPYRHATYLLCHYAPVLAFFAPIHALWPGTEIILITQALLFGLGAIPVYLVVLRFAPRRVWTAFWAALFYLTMPALHWVNLCDFREDTVLIPLLLAAWYAMEARNFRWFICWSILVLMVKEHTGVILAALGLYGLLRGLPRRYGAVAILAGLSWFGFMAWVIYPVVMLTDAWNFRINTGFHFLDQGLGRFLETLLLRPLDVLWWAANSPNLTYLEETFAPVYWLGLLAPPLLCGAALARLWRRRRNVAPGQTRRPGLSLLVAASAALLVSFPSTVLIMLIERDLSFRDTAGYLASGLIPGVVLSSILLVLALEAGVKELAGGRRFAASVAPVLLALSVAGSLSYLIWDPAMNKQLYTMTQNDKVVWAMARMIPPDASVSASDDILGAVSCRKTVVPFDRVGYHLEEGNEFFFRYDALVDYVLVDSSNWRVRKTKYAKALLGDTRYVALARTDNYTLFWRRSARLPVYVPQDRPLLETMQGAWREVLDYPGRSPAPPPADRSGALPAEPRGNPRGTGR
jgi:hypothetical protein